jgi:hypothetical protein
VRKKKHRSGFFAAAGIIIAYFLLFPHPLPRERVAVPRWVSRLPSAEGLPAEGVSADSASAGSLWPFQQAGLVGFTGSTGRIVHAEKVLFGASASGAGFVNYSRVGSTWVLRDPSGGRLFSFEGRGYPLLSGDGGRVFVVKTDLTGLREVDGSGDELWSRDFPSMLTTLSVAGGNVVAGLLDGTVQLVDKAGAARFSAAPAPGRIPVVLGVAAAPDGAGFACISGIEPQSLVLYARKGGSFAESARLALASGFRREVRLAWAPDSRWLAVEGEGSVGAVDPLSGRVAWTRLAGALAGIAFPGERQPAAFLSRSPLGWELLVAPAFSGPLLRASFAAGEASVSVVDGGILLGVDRRLLRVDVEAL